MPKLSTHNLILEVTRRCNMSCAHCLRGNSQDADMTPETLRRVFEIFKDVDEIAFTGGEPSLNVPIINQTIDILEQNGIHPCSFFIATNGKENVDELLQACDRLYKLCHDITNAKTLEYTDIRWLHKLMNSEEAYGGLALSADPYHEPIPLENVLKLMSRTYFTDVKIQEFKKDPFPQLIRAGSAVFLPSELTHEPYISNASASGPDCFEQVYISADGDILFDSDLDYANQPYYKTGSIYDDDIEETLFDLLSQLN